MRKHIAYEREEREYLPEDTKEKKQKKKFSDVHGTLDGIQDNMASRPFTRLRFFLIFSIHQTQIKNKGRKARNLKSSHQIMIHIPGIKSRIHTMEDPLRDKEQA